VRPLTDGAVDTEPAWAPGGRWLAFVRDDGGPFLWRIRRDGADAGPIGTPAQAGNSPAWAP
jgi:Tol biopolymer transport system component